MYSIADKKRERERERKSNFHLLSVVDMCLTKAAEQRKESHARIAFMLASHNEDSVRFAVKVIPL